MRHIFCWLSDPLIQQQWHLQDRQPNKPQIQLLGAFRFYQFQKAHNMGKRTKKAVTDKMGAYRINKKKGIQKNFDAYLSHLTKSRPNITYQQCSPYLHNFIVKCMQTLTKVDPYEVSNTSNKIRICHICKDWIMGAKYVQCQSCEDYYHRCCLFDYKVFQATNHMCESCYGLITIKQQSKRNDSGLENTCNKCEKSIVKRKAIDCLKCGLTFHSACCFKGICDNCSGEIKKRMYELKQGLDSQQQRKITEYLQKKKIKKNYKQANQEADESTRMPLETYRIFRSTFPKLKNQQIQHYKESLLFAIVSKNMKYSEELKPHNCEIYQDVRQSLDFGVPQLGASDLKIYWEYKQQPIGPFILDFREGMGYDVIADSDLPKGMLVCEYVGDVYSHRQALSMEENDSRMELKRGEDADSNLFIIPHKETNIARFINSVREEDKHKLNVCSTRCYIQGKPAVLLSTSRPIRKGESLLYDYNAGQAKQGYDTSDYQ